MLIPPELLPRLHRLRLGLPQRVQPTAGGDHLARTKGRSMEFAEHRDYSPGDDLRHLDWNVMARHEKLVIKLYRAEMEQTVTVLVDLSLSMEGAKAALAVRLAAALGVVGLAGHDRVGLALLNYGAGERPDYLPPLRGTNMAHRLFQFLEGRVARGRCDLDQALRLFGRRQGRPGQLIVCSDFLEPGGGLEGLNTLLYAKNRVTLLQILSRAEREPELVGDYRLKDAETGELLELTAGQTTLRRYREALEAHNARLREWALRRGCHYQLVTAEDSLAEQVQDSLRKSGLLR